MDLETIVEGSTTLVVPAGHNVRGPGRRTGTAFYNRQMAFNRDVSILVLDALDLDGRPVLDSMAGTGARGVRIANELPGRFKVTVNDRDPISHHHIERNIAINETDAEATDLDMRVLLAQRTFSYVDVDPFGSPVPFVHAAIQGTRRKGVLAITATDTAPLAGSRAAKGLRRYGSRPLRDHACHETGLRILMAYIVRQLAQYDRGMSPLLCYFADHYMRLYVRLEEGAAAADRALSTLEPMRPEGFGHVIGEGGHGPLWAGPLWDHGLLDSLDTGRELAEPARCGRFIDTLRGEIDVPMFYEVDVICSLLKVSPPRMDDLLSRLRENGRASRTHFSPTGFRTDLSQQGIEAAFLDICSKG